MSIRLDTPPSLPAVLAVNPGRIPDLLKREKRWVCWWAGPLKQSGKFDKYPVDPLTGAKINPLDERNWQTYEDAMNAYRRDMAKGIGIVLSDRHPLMVDGVAYTLAALDFDNCTDQIDELRALWVKLGQPYVERSPSGNGLRMLGLTTTPMRGGNAGGGREMYFGSRYVTVTGVEGQGKILDFTAGVLALEREWFGVRSPKSTLSPPSVAPTLPETRDNAAQVLSMLDRISSDVNYETWRDICWALASTGWVSAARIAHIWSARAAKRYEPGAVDALVHSFDPSRGITLGTLQHHARAHGWVATEAEVATVPAFPGTPFYTARELQGIPATPYVVRGVLPAQGLAAIYGEPGSGKSFLALDIAHAIAIGRPTWFGFNVNQMPVVYVALEGQGGIAKRTQALEAHIQQACPDTLRFCTSDLQLLEGGGSDELAEQISETLGKGVVVIIDTLNQAAPCADENASQDMGRIIANAKRLAASVDGLVILVHHSGKDRSRGLRGHSSLFAAMDAVIEVRKSAAGKEWCLTKSKDDLSGGSFDFDLKPYVIGQDAFGPITSCAVQQAVHIKTPQKREPTGKHQRAAVAELRRLLPVPSQQMEYEAALQQIASVLTCPPGRSRSIAKDTIDSLILNGHVCLDEGCVCLV